MSLLAPFAVITLSDFSNFEDGSVSEPCIEALGFDEAEFRKSKGEKAFETLLNLRAALCSILEKYKIAVIPEEEWRKAVPGLRAEPDVFVGAGGEPLRVLDALFFEGM